MSLFLILTLPYFFPFSLPLSLRAAFLPTCWLPPPCVSQFSPFHGCPVPSWTEAGQWLGQATQRHLEAMPRTHTHTLIIPEALGPHTIQDHSSDFMA